MKLTQAALRSLIKKPGRHSDGGGLYFRVLPGQKCYWVYRYTVSGKEHETSKERETSLGPFPELGQAFETGLHRDHFKAGFGEDAVGQDARGRFVIHDENPARTSRKGTARGLRRIGVVRWIGFGVLVHIGRDRGA